jgi:hypothetical protein
MIHVSLFIDIGYIYIWIEQLCHLKRCLLVKRLGQLANGLCRCGFTTLPPMPLQEQYRCGSFVGGAQIAQGVGYLGIQRTRRFMWFGPLERNTLRPRMNGVALLD